MKFRSCLGALCAGFVCSSAPAAAAELFLSEESVFTVEAVAEEIRQPWGMAFLPDGGILVTEKGGRLLRVDDGETVSISGVPEVALTGQGGLLDVALHPQFADNGWVYLTHAASYDNGFGTALFRGRLEGTALVDGETLFRTADPPQGGVHFGSRLAFDAGGYLYITVGDRGDRDHAQDLGAHYGKVLRLRDDGSAPADNPFSGVAGARPEIYSYGHRNPQGLFYDPVSAQLWEHEHGPQGGDTLNILRAGANYGWPVATYGDEYGGGEIGVTPEDRADIENPITWWGPFSIAPSGLTRLHGTAFPRWRGNLFLGALGQQHIRRLVLAGETVIHQEELLRDQFGRIRDVEAGPDGKLYFLTDSAAGGVYRLVPVPWVFNRSLGKWLYSLESSGGESGYWLYVPRTR